MEQSTWNTSTKTKWFVFNRRAPWQVNVWLTCLFQACECVYGTECVRLGRVCLVGASTQITQSLLSCRRANHTKYVGVACVCVCVC